MGKEWDDVKTEMSSEFSKLKKAAPGYSYEDTHAAIATDEKFCNFIVEQIRVSKDRLFNITELLYELKIDALSKLAEDLRNDIDIFSDEIKVRHSSMDILTEHWAKRIVRHDYDLMEGIGELNARLERLLRMITDLRKIGSRGPYQPDELEKIRKEVKNICGSVDELVRIFKEREAICNIKSVSFDRIYRKIKRDVKGRI